MKRLGTFIAAAVLAAIVLVGLLGPVLPYDPVADVSTRSADLPPSAAHWLGTDHLGRDVAWRLALACRAFVIPGLGASLVAAGLGVPLGALAGYHGGVVETAIRQLFSILATLPRFVLVLLWLSIRGSGEVQLALAAGVSFVPELGEAVFARIAALRHDDYVLANRAHGVPSWRILWVHLVWAACRRTIGRGLVELFGAFLVVEATLSYVGSFGVREPWPSWGNMLVFEWGREGNPVDLLAAALAIYLAVAAVTWVGGWLAEVET